jgi:hypothetical protein
MPYSTKWEPSGVLWTFYGEVTGDEILRANREIYGDPRFHRLTWQLVDLTGVERFDVTEDDMATIAVHDRAAARDKPHIRVAVAAAGREHQGSFRVLRRVVSSCETWNCAASALVMANGEPNVIVLPTNVPDLPWLILKRVEEGSLYIPETEAFGCDVYDAVADATNHYTAMETCRKGMVLTVPDGRSVVVALQKCDGARRRAVH